MGDCASSAEKGPQAILFQHIWAAKTTQMTDDTEEPASP